MNDNNLNNNMIFKRGEEMPEQFSKYFSGNAWLEMLIMPGDSYNCPIGNVTFEAGCRNNWHKHPGGQILLVTEGRGWYEEEGKKPRELHRGDVVKIPKNVKHWHGAAKDSDFVHISVETNVAEGAVIWLEPILDEHYNKLK